jgi:hypothetical protein
MLHRTSPPISLKYWLIPDPGSFTHFTIHTVAYILAGMTTIRPGLMPSRPTPNRTEEDAKSACAKLKKEHQRCEVIKG